MIPGWLLLGLLGAAHGEPEAPAAIYMVMVDRFANGDERNDADADPGVPTAFHGGDLQGIIDHLDSIQAMGFTQLWMSPIAQMRTEPISGHGAFHGYWVEDGARLEPRFGSPDVLEDLRLALKARRMVPVLDLVTNHVAPDAPLTRSHPEWFHGLGDVVDWADPTQRIQHDVHGLPDLAQERPEVTSHLISQARAWGAGADPIRLDAVRHLPPSFVRAYREALSGPEEPAIVYGEIFEGNTVRLARAASEYGLDHTFDFPLHYALVDVFCRGADARVIAAVLSGDSAYAPGSVHLSFLDNHDLPRIRTACGGDEQQVAAAMELMLALRGIPVITYGTESGLVGQTETEARSDMDFERVAPVGRVIQEGLARRRSQPAIARAPTVTAWSCCARAARAPCACAGAGRGECRGVRGRTIDCRSPWPCCRSGCQTSSWSRARPSGSRAPQRRSVAGIPTTRLARWSLGLCSSSSSPGGPSSPPSCSSRLRMER